MMNLDIFTVSIQPNKTKLDKEDTHTNKSFVYIDQISSSSLFVSHFLLGSMFSVKIMNYSPEHI